MRNAGPVSRIWCSFPERFEGCGGRRASAKVSGPMLKDYVFTSESVNQGHPDKVCDQISDAILDALLAQDPHSRVDCESLIKTGLVVIAGEITTKATGVNFGEIAKKVIRDIGYTSMDTGFSCDTAAVVTAI